jgi:ABC-2 type transport system ATP-binding protein
MTESERSEAPVIEVRGLVKTFRIGFFRKKVEAVRGVDFEVRRGEIFGLLGPNGAGKTTSIKTLLRLIFPTAGTVRLFGSLAPGPEAMRRVGYLPENPYVYQYLRAHEFLDLCGRLCGMDARARARRSEEMIARVGLGHAVDRPIGRFSKGMLQRIGLAQALLHDPELLILDEPMSGLDPIGRKEVRDLVLEERSRGKTILFTSHILSDVERLCDRVAIVHRGKVTAYGALSELLRPEVQRTEVELDGADAALREKLEAMGVRTTQVERRLVAIVEGQAGARDVLDAALAAGARVVTVHEQRETLEDLFVRDALRSGGAPADR